MHRCCGLAIAVFITVAALTGSILAFKTELNAWINPPDGVPSLGRTMLDPLQLRARAMELVPSSRVDWVNLEPVSGQSYELWLQRNDNLPAASAAVPLRIFLNPYTGDEVRRDTASTGGYPYWPLNRHNLLDFVNSLHVSLTMPGEIGRWLLGIVALVWTFDCLVSLYLTLPPRNLRYSDRGFWRRWAPAWKLKWPTSAYRFHFNLHRASGLWAWLVLLMFAWSSVGFNLREEVYNPIMTSVFGMQVPYPTHPLLKEPISTPEIGWQDARLIGRRLMDEQAQAKRFTVGAEGWLYYDSARGLYTYCVHSPLDVPSWCSTQVVFSGMTGALLAFNASSGHGNAATDFTTWISTLHMAAVWGLPLKIAVCLAGILTTMLTWTGVYLWWKKRKVRRQARDEFSLANGCDNHVDAALFKDASTMS